jgi:lysophospholipase L1-like esterase
MKYLLKSRRSGRCRQPEFSFLERSRRLERWFKWVIALMTCLMIALILSASPWGRYGTATAAASAREAVRQALGLPRPRSEVDESWRRYRELGIEESRRALDRVFAEAEPPYQRLMQYAGLDPAHGLLRWGNFNLTLLLPSTVFEADDQGRSYRLKPRTKSIWLRNLTLKSGVLMFFLVPDGPGLAEAARGTPAIAVETSRQTTNSWGLRGPEPEPDAPVRGIVLGDSYMQGLFIGDDETPPECLRRYLQKHLKTRVSILNTGVMGYSPEQYYYSLMAFAERFRPQFVVVSLFTNDFGDLHEVPTKGIGDWEEGKYWLEKIVDYCRARQWPHVIVPAPYQPGMFAKRKGGHYPGMISNVLEVNGLMFLDPIDDFIDAHLEAVIADERKGRRQQGCSLFNDAIGDGHFSAAGAEVWAASVGRRLVLLMEKDRLARERDTSGARASQGAPE